MFSHNFTKVSAEITQEDAALLTELSLQATIGQQCTQILLAMSNIVTAANALQRYLTSFQSNLSPSYLHGPS